MSQKDHSTFIRKTFGQGEDKKRLIEENLSEVEKARRIQRDKRKEGPQGDREESEPKRLDPHALVLGMETSETSFEAKMVDGSMAAFINEVEVRSINGLATIDVNEEEVDEEFFDEKTWETLDPAQVREARKEEVDFMKN